MASCVRHQKSQLASRENSEIRAASRGTSGSRVMTSAVTQGGKGIVGNFNAWPRDHGARFVSFSL